MKVHSITEVQHQCLSKQVPFEDDVVSEIFMPADKTLHELIPIYPLISYRSIPRHTP